MEVDREVCSIPDDLRIAFEDAVGAYYENLHGSACEPEVFFRGENHTIRSICAAVKLFEDKISNETFIKLSNEALRRIREVPIKNSYRSCAPFLARLIEVRLARARSERRSQAS
jgi:hypothetical protein